MINVNLLPWREAQAERAKRLLIKSIILYSVLAVIILVISYFIFANINARYEDRIQQIKQRSKELQAATVEYQKIKQLREKSIYVMSVIDQVNRKRYLPLKILNALKEILPKEVALSSLEIKTDRVVFIGYSPINFRTVDLEHNILKSDLFQSADIVQVQLKQQQKEKQDLYHFKIEAVLKHDAGAL